MEIKNNIIEVLNKEIIWALNESNQKENEVTIEQATWFAKGLNEAISIIETVYIIEDIDE